MRKRERELASETEKEEDIEKIVIDRQTQKETEKMTVRQTNRENGIKRSKEILIYSKRLNERRRKRERERERERESLCMCSCLGVRETANDREMSCDTKV